MTTADEPPTTNIKKDMIVTGRSDGMQIVFDAAAKANKSTIPILWNDRVTREWLRTKVGDPDYKMDTLTTIRDMLRHGGMTMVDEFKTKGVRRAVFANQAAMNFQATYEKSWEQMREEYMKFPEELFKDEGPDKL